MISTIWFLSLTVKILIKIIRRVTNIPRDKNILRYSRKFSKSDVLASGMEESSLGKY